jgi:Mn-dependent DtxR family transcriptional regulator
MRFLKANPSSRIGAIARALDVKPETISVQLTKLRESKQIRSEGKARATSYSCASRAA